MCIHVVIHLLCHRLWPRQPRQSTARGNQQGRGRTRKITGSGEPPICTRPKPHQRPNTPGAILRRLPPIICRLRATHRPRAAPAPNPAHPTRSVTNAKRHHQIRNRHHHRYRQRMPNHNHPTTARFQRQTHKTHEINLKTLRHNPILV